MHISKFNHLSKETSNKTWHFHSHAFALSRFEHTTGNQKISQLDQKINWNV